MRKLVLGDLYAAIGVDSSFRPACLGEHVNPSQRQAPDLAPELLTRLRDYFAASDAALSRLLDRKVPWPTK